MLPLTRKNENDPEFENCQYLSVNRSAQVGSRASPSAWSGPTRNWTGLYIQFEDITVDRGASGLAGRSALRSLCQAHTVGVWGHGEAN